MDNYSTISNTVGLNANAGLPAKHVSLVAAPFYFVKNNAAFFFTLFALLYAVQLVYNVYLHPLSKVPGPPLAKLNYVWLNVHRWGGQWHETTHYLHRTYGPVVRIAPNEVSFVDKDGLKRLYGFGVGTAKTPWYQTWQMPNVSVSFFATQNVAVHRQLRSRVATAYTMSSVLPMEPFIQDVLDKMWVKMRHFSREQKPFDMSKWLYFFTYDVISELALGGASGFIEKGEDLFDLIKSIAAGFKTQAGSGHFPGQAYWFDNPVTQWYINNFCSHEAKGQNLFLKFISDRYDERAKNGLGDRRRDMLQHFFEMKTLTGNPIDKGEVLSEGVLTLGAGGDTTATALAGILGRLITNPEVVPLLQAEVDAAYKRLGLRKDEGISYIEASTLPYMNAVIKEAMRLFPVVQWQMPRMAPEEGITIDGHFIPKGSHLGVSPFVMNRSKDVFGPTADEFRPQRWIPTSETEAANVKEASSLLTTFGMGSRGCIGKNIAMSEIIKFVAQFVRQFEIKAANRTNLWKTENFFATKVEDFMCTLSERTD